MTGRRGRGTAGYRGTDDSGITLIEVVVSMSIMSFLMAIFTVGIVQLYRSANHTESLSTAASQLNTVFIRLDDEIRYATAISRPGSTGAGYYVEYLTTSPGSRTCTQLRLNTAAQQLQMRTWPQESPAQATTWRPIASGVGADANQPPFALDPISGSPYDRLRLRLVASQGGKKTESDITFTAVNTVTPHPEDVCGEGRP
ncbi:prepilin-type N-terminal cleavage/methylation domain-containing protein [Planosporangium mesophilum]|uniref:Prepilin-type N-terminal cleavage/methylation domain-containing protein n=1 Tax=Planosporangium mesophilum TaxID=689768 RepID=A0A8J3TEU7_9ACTN|nr:prepilin-type N-terminal cleavage/methylation domain-containing protein [Planosporangium mesophilum]NJC85606.1 hypothetical protein [Planosporangium mesophilum]GII24527.1 hypothetical protein Pme01_41240 [Planosporangium mesophilum]